MAAPHAPGKRGRWEQITVSALARLGAGGGTRSALRSRVRAYYLQLRFCWWATRRGQGRDPGNPAGRLGGVPYGHPTGDRRPGGRNARGWEIGGRGDERAWGRARGAGRSRGGESGGLGAGAVPRGVKLGARSPGAGGGAGAAGSSGAGARPEERGRDSRAGPGDARRSWAELSGPACLCLDPARAEPGPHLGSPGGAASVLCAGGSGRLGKALESPRLG